MKMFDASILPRELDERKVERLTRMSDADINRFIAFCAIREYLFDHPFSALGPRGNRIFNDDYRRFVVSLTAPGDACEHMSVDELSQVTGVYDCVLEDWLCQR